MGNAFMLIKPVFAQVETEFGPVNDVIEYLNKILGWLVPALGALALIAFIYAGYLLLTSQGNPESITKAKEIIIVTITGIVLLFTARLILTQIGVI